MGLLPEIKALSRGKCGRGALTPKSDSGEPLAEGGERNVKKTDLEHGQERHGDELPVLDGEINEVGEIKRERHFRHGQKRFERHVLAGAPGLSFALDPVLRRAREIRFVIEDRLEHRPGIIKRKTDAERRRRLLQQYLLHPGARVQLALRAYVKDGDGDGSREEDRRVEKERPHPTSFGPTGGRMEKHA